MNDARLRTCLTLIVAWVSMSMVAEPGHAGWRRCRLGHASRPCCYSQPRCQLTACLPLHCPTASHNPSHGIAPTIKSGQAASAPTGHEVDTAAQPKTAPAAPAKTDKNGWTTLFDGKTLQGWASTEFGGEGDVYVEDGAIILGFGSPLTGITYQGKHPLINYEIRLDGMRREGSDFFCGLTFPVKDSHCSFIVGGWGGGVIGLSSLDGMDASENETTNYMQFEKKKWYQIRVRVTEQRIEAWIDKDQFVDSDITHVEVSIRPEVDLSRPLGIANFDTQSALKNIQIRELSPAEVAAAAASDDE